MGQTPDERQMYFFYVQKVLQAITVRTEKVCAFLTGQQASKRAGLFVGAVIWSSSGFQLGSSIKTRSSEVKYT